VAEASVTIVSLNLHCGLSSLARPYSVADALAGLDADVIAVQESWWPIDEGADGSDTDGSDPDGSDPAPDPVAEAARRRGARLIRTRLAGPITLAQLGIAPRHEPGNWGIAVLSSLPVAGHETLSLGQPTGDPVSRGALICSVTTPGGWPLRLVCTHLSPRLNSPKQLYQLTRHLVRAPAPTVIAGDLNMPRLATWVAGGYVPTVRGRTFPAEKPVVQLDHLLISPGLTCMAAEILPSVGSDHLPIRARFTRAARLRRALTAGPAPRPGAAD
jgi:endonuclease/exonuclease/phosphatase family metal-dependent hydrolase